MHVHAHVHVHGNVSPWQAEQLDLLTTDAPQHKPTGWSALHLLANRPDRGGKRAELTTLMLEKGADPNRLTARQATPLHTAAGTANAPVAEILLRHPGVDVNAKNKDGKHPWDCAASNRMLQNIIQQHGGVESPNKTGASSKDEPNARKGQSASRLKRAERWTTWNR